MKITWFGTASIRIDIQGLSLLFDPFVPLPGACFSLSVDDFLPAPHVFITHGHLDHLISVPELVARGAGTVYATAAPCAILAEQGVLSESLRTITPGDELRFLPRAGSCVSDELRFLPRTGSCVSDELRFLPRTGSSVSDEPQPLLTAHTDTATVKVLQGTHIQFDILLALATLLSPRMLHHRANADMMRKANKTFREHNETVVYEVSHGDVLVTVMGSLALVDEELYTAHPDLLICPYQGNTHLEPIALSIIERLMPRTVMLNHFDDSFPPISRAINTDPLVKTMAQRHPEIQVIVPTRGVSYSVHP